MKTILVLGLLGSLAIVACASPSADETDDSTSDDLSTSAATSFVARGTGYYPDGSALEGGFVDRKGAPLRTLQQFLAGQADYVSVAMDVNAFAYGQRLRIHELETKYGKAIVFKVVDTGGDFRGKGRTRIDVCTANEKASLDATINGTLHIDVVSGNAPSPAPTTTTPPPAPTTTTPPPAPTTTAPPPAPSGGAVCSNDGMCNPGNDGAGLICVSSRCTPGCRTDAQCPGVTSCVSGQCQ